VLVCAPHTSLWDGFFMLLGTSALGLRVRWMVKEEATRPPWGWLLNRLGAIPVRRSAPGGLVHEMVEAFASTEDLVLAIAPSGTRARRPGWKIGFHAIARSARVDLVPAFIDYGRRRVGVGEVMGVTDDVDADLALLRAFFDGIEGRFPALQTPIRVVTPEGDHGRDDPLS
jgi:1-acyl-sn-glycerol-3-phosphate acyltransferase